MTTELSIAAQAHAQLRDELKEAYALEDDSPVLVDTLDGVSDFKEMVEKAALAAVADEAMAEGLGMMIDNLNSRKARFKRRAERIRDAIKWAMGEAGEKKIAVAGVTVSRSDGKPKITFRVTPDEAPDKFVRVTREFDKTAVRTALEAKEQDAESIAILGNPEPVLTIRTK